MENRDFNLTSNIVDNLQTAEGAVQKVLDWPKTIVPFAMIFHKLWKLVSS